MLFLKNKFWLSASTHDGEEDFCLKTHLLLKKEFGKLKTLIAPRHISRSSKIKNYVTDIILSLKF